MVESYPSHWLHGTVHLDPKTGELHTDEPSPNGGDGPHPLRQALLHLVGTHVPALFQTGDFTLRSGKKSKWKIECDALSDSDWAGLAAMAAEILPPFRYARGVPSGGLPFAEALQRYATGQMFDPILIAEDVCTTGGSMVRFRHSISGVGDGEPVPVSEYIGVCVFAREPTWPEWVKPLFCFNPAGVVEQRLDEWESNRKWEDGAR